MEDKGNGKDSCRRRPLRVMQIPGNVENLPSVSQPCQGQHQGAAQTRQVLRTIQNCAQLGTVQKIKRNLEIHEGFGNSKVQKAATSQTGSCASEAQRLMVQEPASVEYWAQLAEQRRIALEDTLLENERLMADLVLKEAELERLRQENEELAELAAKASYLADVVEKLSEDASPTEYKEGTPSNVGVTD
uniref:geminin n=1 Tax=Myxine glutinosa TaxID=7769 RepID=UPI00358E1992